MIDSTTESQPDRMRCMEVWGGNRAVQHSFEAAGLRIWAFSQPFENAKGGGDVYYLSSCASGRITRMLLADVSGHGEQVSNVAKGLRDLMRRNINVIKQTRFVSAMNRQFAAVNQGSNFATALVTTFFAPTKTLSVCNAGHPPPLIYRQRSKQWFELTGEDQIGKEISDIPLGVADEAIYYQQDVRLEPGDMLLSFSDAVTESSGSDGHQLGGKGVLKLVSELNASFPDQIIPSLIDEIGILNESNLNTDDTTILLIQATGSRTPLKNSLLAPFRMASRATDATVLE